MRLPGTLRALRQAFALEAASRTEGAAFALLLIVVLIAPFPYGGFLPGGRLRIEVVAFAALFAAALGCRGSLVTRAIALPAAAGIGIAILGTLQWLPLGRDLVASLSPASAAVYAETERLARLFDDVPPLWWRISLAPDSTAGAVLLVLAFVALFVASAALVDNRGRRNVLTLAILAGAVGHAAWAIAQPVADNRIHGAFVNPNNFAGYLHLAFGAALGLVWSEALRNRERAAGLRDRARRLEARALPLLWRVLVLGATAAAIAATRSRAGIAAAIAAAATAFVLMPFHARMRRRRTARLGWVAAGLAAGVLFVALTAGSAPFLRYVASDPRDAASDTRVTLWRTSVDAWRSFPALGSGLGTFREAYRPVQPASIDGLVEHAHNDSLQMLVTGGAVGLALAAVAFGWLLFGLARGWLRQEHRHESGIVLGGFVALLALLLHGIAEFNMSVPAIPATLAVLLGAAWRARQ